MCDITVLIIDYVKSSPKNVNSLIALKISRLGIYLIYLSLCIVTINKLNSVIDAVIFQCQIALILYGHVFLFVFARNNMKVWFLWSSYTIVAEQEGLRVWTHDNLTVFCQSV